MSLSLFAVTTAAQSGRRSVKASPSVPPPAETKPVDTQPAAKDQKDRMDLTIGTEHADVFTNIPPYFYDSVLVSCSRRLDDSRGVRVNVVSREMSRADAINSAKAAKQGYVIWLQLRTDGNGNDLSDIRIQYWVFTSVTGKVATQGTSYQGSYRTGGVVLSPRTAGSNNPAIAESRLKDSAREAADRILKSLNIAVPSDIPSH